MNLSRLAFTALLMVILLIGCNDTQDIATPFSPGKTTTIVDDTTIYIGWLPDPLNNNGVRGDTVVKKERRVGGLNMKQ